MPGQSRAHVFASNVPDSAGEAIELGAKDRAREEMKRSNYIDTPRSRGDHIDQSIMFTQLCLACTNGKSG